MTLWLANSKGTFGLLTFRSIGSHDFKKAVGLKISFAVPSSLKIQVKEFIVFKNNISEFVISFPSVQCNSHSCFVTGSCFMSKLCHMISLHFSAMILIGTNMSTYEVTLRSYFLKFEYLFFTSKHVQPPYATQNC